MRAKRSFGQNFLQDQACVERIVAAADLRADDVVVEIGPGLGALTQHLVDRTERVVAIEADAELIPVLRSSIGVGKALELINADALNFDFHQIASGRDLKLVANLPYNISTPILQRLIEQRSAFSLMVLMFQREVAQRIAAPAGGRERGYLSVIVQDAFTLELLFDIEPASFKPVPKVWSSVVRLVPKASGFTNRQFAKEVVSLGFSQKRKTLLNNLRPRFSYAADALAAAGLAAERRGESLTLEEWNRLAEALLARSTSAVE